MVNKPRATGTRAETACTRWFRAHGYAGADRQPLRGNLDQGDIAAAPGLVIEVKSYTQAATGQPPPALLAKWMTECETARTNARADVCPLIVRRKGTTDVGRWWAYLPLRDLVTLTSGQTVAADLKLLPVCMSVATLTAILRDAGYGDTRDEEPTT